LFAGYSAVINVGSASFWVYNDIKNLFIVFINDVLGNLLSFVFFFKVAKDDLNLRHNSYEALLNVKDDSLSNIELTIVNFELIEIISIFNVFDALLNVFRIINLHRFTLLNV
jgi:hypothetical protein